MTNKIEYFAEGVQSFFDANMPSSGSPTTRSGCRIVCRALNEALVWCGDRLVSREELLQRDPGLHAFLVKYLGDNSWSWNCDI